MLDLTKFKPWIIREAKIAPNDMLQQTNRLCLNKLANHIAQNSSYSIKTFISGTDIGQPHFIQQNLLNDKNSNLNKEIKINLLLNTIKINLNLNKNTVLDSSLPVSIIRKHRGIISVDNKNEITSGLSFYNI